MNLLQGKHNGIMGSKIRSNKGVFQGSPICALLYITFADGILREYKQNIIPIKTTKTNMIVKKLTGEYRWSEHRIYKLQNGDPDKENKNSRPTLTRQPR